MNQTTTYLYDADKRLREVDDAAGGKTLYGYDEVGNRTSQQDANGNQTLFEYDEVGRRTKRTLPLGGFEKMVYDGAGNLVSKTDFNNKTTSYGYDAMNRLQTKAPDAFFNVAPLQFTYTPTGRRWTAVDARGTTTYGYDARDRLASVKDPGNRVVGYGYHPNGARKQLSVAVGLAVLTTLYDYDAAGRLQTVTDSNTGQYVTMYDAANNRTSLLYPNGVLTTYVPDTLNRLKSMTTTKNAGTLQSFTYTPRADGLRTAVDDLDGTHRAYTYDALNRLTDETIKLGGVLNYENGFVYDAGSNRKTQTHTTLAGAVQNTYGYDANDRLSAEVGHNYGWDSNGNLQSRSGVGGSAEVWDFEDRLTKVAASVSCWAMAMAPSRRPRTS